MTKEPSVCVVVAIRNRKQLTKRFLNAFYTTNYENFKIVLVDDLSTDGSVEMINSLFPQAIVLKGNGNLWWTGATNLGVKYALKNNFDYVLTINNDAILETDFLTEMMEFANIYPNVILGTVILRSDNRKIWSVGGHLSWESDHLFNLNYAEQDISAISNLGDLYEVEILNGNGTLIPTKVFRKIGLYNTFFTPHYHSDTEIIYRAKRNGIKAYVCTKLRLINEISYVPNVVGKKDIIFHKKSDFLWKPLIYFYLVYGPKKHFPNFFKQYSQFFVGFSLIGTLKSLIKKIFFKKNS